MVKEAHHVSNDSRSSPSSPGLDRSCHVCARQAICMPPNSDAGHVTPSSPAPSSTRAAGPSPILRSDPVYSTGSDGIACAGAPYSPSHNTHAAKVSDAPIGLPHAFMTAKKALAMPFTRNADSKHNTSAVSDAARVSSSPMVSKAAAAAAANFTGGVRTEPGVRSKIRQCGKVCSEITRRNKYPTCRPVLCSALS